ncbi:MAG TPA: multiheme c-type cytochrome [Thermoanaerobaculia bacterium]|nr:multiheme c-type cytochrome [Thermoanaerobaculia bacterium]
MRRLAAFAALSCAALLFAQQPTSNQQPVTSNTPTIPGHYLGAASCANSGCHGSTQPLDATHVLQNEFYTWLNSDRHAGAYNVLFNDRSARIVKNMRLRRKAYEENLCLDCHTTNVPASLVDGAIDPEDGIQCEACHGPAGGWRAEHMEPNWTHEQSVARGMIDLRSVNARGTLCASCHVGNAKKEVDHELIASGHPLLPFELDNYTETMPPHWILKYAGGRDTHGAKAWAVGQVVAFRESVDNLARHARGEKWPEFSDMSCFNCHHDLKDSAWRQQRGWPDRAGLPAWSPQRWAMLRLIVGRVSPQTREQLEPLIAQLARGVARMNDAAGVAANAERARKIAADLVPRVESMRWSDADVRALMTSITDDRAFLANADVFAAEQAALSLQSLASVLTRRNPKLLKSAMTKSIDALFDEVQNRDDYDAARFAQKLAAVKAAL